MYPIHEVALQGSDLREEATNHVVRRPAKQMDRLKGPFASNLRKSHDVPPSDKGECLRDKKRHHHRTQCSTGTTSNTISTATDEHNDVRGGGGGGKADTLPQNMKSLSLRDVRNQTEQNEWVVEGKLRDPGDPKGHSMVLETTIKTGQGSHTVTYTTEKVVGNGSFGVVYKASCVETGQTVAIKKVLQDRRFKNRELQIMRLLDHPNIVRLQHCFATINNEGETYLHLVLDYIPDTVFRICRQYMKNCSRVPLLFVKLYVHQMCRSLAHLHRMGVCHRDIKPQNLLVNTETHELKLCDFGSAKVLVKGEPNISYICSRYYRAPELIFGATEYTTAIDIWSVGCVMAELLIGQPIFPGESGVDQLVEIIKVLGTPTREEIISMNPNYTDFKFPQLKAHPLTRMFKRVPADAVDLVSQLLVYNPTKRMSAQAALGHPFFDELRSQGVKLPDGRPLPVLFNWLPGELDRAPPELRDKLNCTT